MPSVSIYTYSDAIDHCLSLLGSNTSGDSRRDSLRAIQGAYREFSNAHRWSYYYQLGRLNTVASQTTGTIAYTNSTRQVTLTGATWPSWVAFGVIVINNVAYQIVGSVSSTVVTLSLNSNPGADVAGGTAYMLYRDTYPMPVDFLAADQFAATGSSIAFPSYVHPSEWLIPQQFQHSPGTPRRYTFASDPHYLGVMAVRFHPAPDNVYTFDYIYQRRPRQLLVDEYKTGTVTAGISTATVTGTGTAFAAKHVGSIIRLSADNTNYPTGAAGLNPFATQRVIIAVNSATSITVDANFTEDYPNAVKYVISDPVDIEDGAMLVAFERCIEKQTTISRVMKSKVDWVGLYRQALIEAMEADSRSFVTRRAGSDYPYRPRLALYPRGNDIS